MDRFDFNLQELADYGSSRSRPTQKRKWREIEAIKERKRLLKELQSIDPTFSEHALEQYEI